MRLQPIENLSKTYSGDTHLHQTELNGLLLLTIHGVLSGHQGGLKCAKRWSRFIYSQESNTVILAKYDLLHFGRRNSL